MGRGGDAGVRASSQKYSAETVAKHCTEDDCWLIIRGKVGDASATRRAHRRGGSPCSSCSATPRSRFCPSACAGRPVMGCAEDPRRIVTTRPLRRAQVYDVSKWRNHPGGRVIYTHAGQDATGAFTGFHSGAAYASMEEFYIGDCSDVAKYESAFEREIRELAPELHKRHLFTARCGCGAVELVSA